MRAVLFVVLAGVLLGGLFLWMRPQEPAPAPAPASPSPAVSLATPAPAAPAVTVREFHDAPVAQPFELVIEKQRLASGPATLSVRQGESVVLRVTSDQREELHLHGYDLKLDLRPGERATLAFVADRSGRFEYELEHAGIELGALEVQPR